MTARRRFVSTAVPLLLLLTALAAEAQDSAARRRVAFLGAESASTNQHFLDAFLQGLRDHGYVDGQNITLDQRWADGRSERFSELARELVQLKPSVILAVSSPAARATKEVTTTIPVVFIASDPLGSGLVPSLGRPGGNLTGLSLFFDEQFSGKWLELLKEAVPKISRVAVLLNPTNPATAAYMTGLRDAARRLKVRLQPLEVRAPDQFDGAFATITAERSQALIVVADPLTVRFRQRLVDLAMKHRLPAMYGFPEFVHAGGLMAYGVDVAYMCRRAADHVDKILKGASPGDLPVEQPSKFELTVNLRAAKALGLTIPKSVLLRAEHVVQ